MAKYGFSLSLPPHPLPPPKKLGGTQIFFLKCQRLFSYTILNHTDFCPKILILCQILVAGLFVSIDVPLSRAGSVAQSQEMIFTHPYTHSLSPCFSMSSIPRGKCKVVQYSDLRSASHFVPCPDHFFYILAYRPDNRQTGHHTGRDPGGAESPGQSREHAISSHGRESTRSIKGGKSV